MIRKQDIIFSTLSKDYNIPRQVIELICQSPFRFAKDKMETMETRPIMFAYLFKIKLKNRYNEKESI